MAGQLIVVCGAGVSMALTEGKSGSWIDLIANGLNYASARGKLNAAQLSRWIETTQSGDIDDLLASAETVTRKLEGPKGALYSKWLESVFSGLSPLENDMAAALRSLVANDIRVCSLNYDALVEAVTHLPSITMQDGRASSAETQRASCTFTAFGHSPRRAS
jgi:hypothetical protein